MNYVVYDHRNGTKIIPEKQLNEVTTIITQYCPHIGLNCARKLKTGLYELLSKKGWSGEYRLDTESMISIGSFLNGIGLNIQTGNAARIYADMLKMQALFVKGKINCGIIITPTLKTANAMGKCMANYERLIRELPIFSQVITMPIVVIGFKGE